VGGGYVRGFDVEEGDEAAGGDGDALRGWVGGRVGGDYSCGTCIFAQGEAGLIYRSMYTYSELYIRLRIITIIGGWR